MSQKLNNMKCNHVIFKFVDKFTLVIKLVLIFLVFLIGISKNAYALENVGQWNLTSSLPYFLASHVSFSSENKLYLIAGSAVTGEGHSEILVSTQLPSGQLEFWSNNSIFPTAPIWHSLARNGNKVYVLGGREENPGSSLGFVNKVFSSEINNVFNTWSQLTNLPQALAHGGSFIANNRLYFAGGLGNANFTSDVIYSAPINADGTIGDWEVSGTLPEPNFNMGIFEKEGRIYMLGGTVGGVGSKKIYTASINSNDGSISNWQELTQAPDFPQGQQTVLVDDQFIFVTGNSTYYSKILSPGVLSEWQVSSNELPYSIGAGRLVENAGYLYLIGGHNGLGYLDTVYYSKIGEPQSEEVVLDVPLFKQTDPLWTNEVYDTATKWAGSNSGIGRWGCAMTSAAMVFNYHKITKLPDGSSLNPKNLNKWLISQPDGYVGNGLINWIALSRLSKLSKSQNPNFTYDALEYSRNNSDDQAFFKANIDNSLPTILGQPGHFVVGKGYSSSTIFINDPGFDREDLSSYSDTFLSMGTYTPSNTDLSYIMIVNNSKINAGLLDDQGQPVGFSFEEEPVIDPSGSGSSSNESLSVRYVEKPGSGDYRIEIVSNETKQYDLDVYLYDTDGNVVTKKIIGVVGEDDLDVYIINYSKETNSLNSIKSEVSFDSLIKDIEQFYELGNIKSLAIKRLLILEVNHIEKVNNRNKKLARVHLLAFPHLVRALVPRHIDFNASQSLIQSINDLRESL